MYRYFHDSGGWGHNGGGCWADKRFAKAQIIVERELDIQHITHIAVEYRIGAAGGTGNGGPGCAGVCGTLPLITERCTRHSITVSNAGAVNAKN